jgi:hypothetical protein
MTGTRVSVTDDGYPACVNVLDGRMAGRTVYVALSKLVP